MNQKSVINKITFSFNNIGELEKISPTISKARVRLFYTGLNRNGTYITEEFAEKLLATLPYAPVGGFWNDSEEDFTDHGSICTTEKMRKEKFRAYGVVPEKTNLSWEDHLDEDGVIRKYACCDVLLWTARYSQAKEIPNKSQSMELYLDSIDGEWVKDDENCCDYFKFTDGCFLGLTALGEGVEPCFEGAAFYSLDETAKQFFYKLENYINQQNNNEGGLEMEEIKETLEPAVEPETEPVTEPEAEPATIPEEPPVVEPEPVESEPVVEPEPVVESEPVVEPENPVATEPETNPEVDVSEYTNKITELETQVANYELKITQLEAELESLKEYKKSQEREQKMQVIEKYSSLLTEDKKEEYKSKIDEYSYEDLKKDVSLEILESNENALFGRQEVTETLTNLDASFSSGAAKIMSKYYSK